jgi:hypothetical protein
VLLFKYNLTIILFVGSIVVVGNTISTFTSTGTTLLTHPIKVMLDVIVGPIGVPDEFDNCIST